MLPFQRFFSPVFFISRKIILNIIMLHAVNLNISRKMILNIIMLHAINTDYSSKRISHIIILHAININISRISKDAWVCRKAGEIFDEGVTGLIHVLPQEAVVLLEVVPHDARARESGTEGSSWCLTQPLAGDFSGFFTYLLLLGCTGKQQPGWWHSRTSTS